jgi:membrane protein implicated in regulation of membrane protease activity
VILLGVYLGALALGGVLIAASALGGLSGAHGADADHGADHGSEADPAANADHAVDADHALQHHAPAPNASLGDSALSATLLSMRFWTFALASFGMLGALLTLIGIPGLASFPVSAVVGTGIGAVVATFFRRAGRQNVVTETSTRAVAGREAQVVLAIGPDSRGKVRLSLAGQTIELLARTREGRRIERGETVLVVSVAQGEAVVTPVQPGHRPNPVATSS